MPRSAFAPTRGVERFRAAGLVGILVLPAVIGVLLAWGVASPQDNLDRITAAVVNNDEPVTVNGQTLPLGRELAAGLVGGPAGSGAPGDPVASSTTTTAGGTDDATTTTAGGTDDASTTDATTTTTSSTTTTTTGESTTTAGSDDAAATTTTDGTSATTTSPDTAADSEQNFNWVLTNSDDAAAGLADGTYDAVLTIPRSFSTRATSISGPATDAQVATVRVDMAPDAAALDAALTQAVVRGAIATFNETVTENYLANVFEGFDELSSSVVQAADGADQLAEGTDTLASGADELASGIDQLQAGLDTLSSGAQTLSVGVGELQQSVQSLPSQTQQLADGSAQVAAVVDQAAAEVNGATQEAAAVVGTICESPGPLCNRATALLGQLEQANSDVAALASGADEVASGNAQLASGIPSLVDGVDGSAEGAAQVADGAESSASGSASVADGAANVASGAAQADSGAQQLAEGLDQLAAQVPTYSDDDIATLSAVVATPAEARFRSSPEGSRLMPVVAVFALWVGAMVLVLGHAVVAPSTLLSSRSSVSLASATTGRLALIGGIQGLAVALVLLPFVDLNASILVYAAVAALVGLVFTVINVGLTALMGGVGRLLAAIAGVFVLAVGITSTGPDRLASLAALTPPAPARTLMRSALGVDSDWTTLISVTLWGAVGFGLAIAGTALRRRGKSLLE